MKELCNRDSQTSHVSVPSTGSKEIVSKLRDKFIREARMIASFDNPHIVKIHDVFEENGTAYYVMEHLSGGSLKDMVGLKVCLKCEDAVKFVREISDALSYIHSQDTLHLDVKPSNVLLNRKGEAVLIDFGISKHYDESGQQTSSTPVGISKGYAPLEQSRTGDVSQFTPSTDIYALGATLYNLVTGLTPPEASIVNEDGIPPLPASVPPGIKAAITASMQPKRKDRPQSVPEFLSLLNGAWKKSIVIKLDRSSLTLVEGASARLSAEILESAGNDSEKTEFVNCSRMLFWHSSGPDIVTVDAHGELRALKPGVGVITVKCGDTAAECRVTVKRETPEPHPPGPNPTPRPPFPRWMIQAVCVIAAIALGSFIIVKIINGGGPEAESVTGSISGHEYVDLGLPSGLLWATQNVGATSPSDYGDYYAWGETSTKSSYSWSNLKYCNDDTGDSFSKYNKDKAGTKDNKMKLELSDDAARANWGGSWRMPTKGEWVELKNNCTWTWTSQGGHKGYRVTGKNGNSIFLPAAGWRLDGSLYSAGEVGFYWSSSLYTAHSCLAYYCYFESSYVSPSRGYYRYRGHSVRPVSSSFQ